MAKYRYINTKFWDDNYIINLDPIEKLLFLYLLTNPLTTICGIYEIQLKRVAFDTGIEKDMVEKIIKRFTDDSKVFYIDGWLAIKNFEKHQSTNPSIEVGIERCKNDVPKQILDKINSLYTACQSLSDNNSNINNNINSNYIAKRCFAESEENKKFNYLMGLFSKINPTMNFGNKTQRKSLTELIAAVGIEKTELAIKYAIGIQGQKYAPTITTPTQLKNKYGELQVYYEREKTSRIISI